MMRVKSRTAVLLGAGASADAGLLLTSQLAAEVVKRANAPGVNRHATYSSSDAWLGALNAIYAGMVNHQGSQGKNPLLAVNIETLISAVRLLQDRENHEVAPFVASWSPALVAFGSPDLPSRAGSKILDAVNKGLERHGFQDREITEAVAEIARAALQPDLATPLKDAEVFVLRTLVDLLKGHRDVDYFDPLLDLARAQAGGLDVVTLNYDLTVESAAEAAGVEVYRGIEDWHPGELLTLPRKDGVLNLLKLHGSLDWRRAIPEGRGDHRLVSHSIEVVSPDDVREHAYGLADLPWIVVGDREKLATDGPTLALYFAAKHALRAASHLAVIGYSFSDFHINSMIRDWLSGDAARTISILDFQLPRRTSYDQPTDFRSALIKQYAIHERKRFGTSHPRRVKLLEGTARARLAEVLVARPDEELGELAVLKVTEEPGLHRFDVTWLGDALDHPQVDATSADGDYPGGRRTIRLGQRSPEGDIEWPRYSGGSIAEWDPGETKTFFAASATPLPLTLTVQGRSIVGGLSWSVVINPSATAPS